MQLSSPYFFVNQLLISVDNTYAEQRTRRRNKLTLGLKVPTVYWKVGLARVNIKGMNIKNVNTREKYHSDEHKGQSSE